MAELVEVIQADLLERQAVLSIIDGALEGASVKEMTAGDALRTLRDILKDYPAHSPPASGVAEEMRADAAQMADILRGAPDVPGAWQDADGNRLPERCVAEALVLEAADRIEALGSPVRS